MNSKPHLCILVLPYLFVALTANLGLAQIEYNVLPVSYLGGTYELVGGTIRTDGTLGPLQPSNIGHWEINVTGPVPFTFSPSNQGSRVEIGGLDGIVRATPTEILLNNESFLRFKANDNSLPECTDCEQLVRWTRNIAAFPPPPVPYVRGYRFDDRVDDDPMIGAFNFDEFTVIARVPEPGISMLMMWGLVGIIGCARRL